MAKKNAVWGIDIGQCALKAVRCTLSDDGEMVVADAFDYIEYPKLLTQPEADPEELVREALQQFLSRNPTKGDKVSVSVSGQSGLARFIKLPPVEVKKIPDIVKYEAKQQIPFKLEEVIWDYQQLPGTIVEEGFAMEAEVGLFAMKRDQVFRAIAPYQKAEIDLDIVQLAPIAIYNAVSHDTLDEVEDYDPENPPEYLVVLSIGTETTDLVITNGYRVWQRSIPLGGNHFTKQLTKELKLTFAKAEHLKRNARQAEDPKAIFQAMRPVFADLEKEVRRSINFFRNNDRTAQLGKLMLLGNTTKLPGLPQYLEKNLDMEVLKPEAFNKLEGSDVVDSPAFKENVLSFAVCYGLALQGLGKGKLATNLVPRELLTARLVREKKPWAVAALAVLLLGLMLNFVFHYVTWKEVVPDFEVNGVTWTTAKSAATSANSTLQGYQSTDSQLKSELARVEAIGREVIGNTDGRLLWVELLRTINAALPVDPRMAQGETPDPVEVPFGERQTLYINSIESQYFEDLSTWFTEPVKEKYMENLRAWAGDEDPTDADVDQVAAANGEAATGEAATGDPTAAAPGEDAAADPVAAAPSDPAATPADATVTPADATPAPADATAAGDAGVISPDSITAPTGAGWVIELKGHHFYNLNRETEGSKHLRNTLIRNLEMGVVLLPAGPDEPEIPWTMKEMGIMFPIIAQDKPIDRKHRIPNPAVQQTAEGAAGYGAGESGAMEFGASARAPGAFAPGASARAPSKRGAEKKKDEPQQPAFFAAPKYEFVVQFAWQEKKLSERLEARRQKAQEAAEAAAQAGGEIMPDGTQAAPKGQPIPEDQLVPQELGPAPDPDALPEDQPQPPAPVDPNGAVPPQPGAAPPNPAGAAPIGPNGGPNAGPNPRANPGVNPGANPGPGTAPANPDALPPDPAGAPAGPGPGNIPPGVAPGANPPPPNSGGPDGPPGNVGPGANPGPPGAVPAGNAATPDAGGPPAAVPPGNGGPPAVPSG